MPRLRAAAVAAAVAAASLAACKKSEPPPDPGPATPAPRDAPPPLPPPADAIEVLGWTITKGAAPPSYLIATLDAGVDTARIAPAVWARLETSRIAVLQWNFAEVTMPMLQRTQGALSTDLTPAQLATLRAAIGDKFVADLEQVKPSFVATVVSAHGLETRSPMQAVINQRAQDAGVATVYLETGVDQQALLDRWLDLRALRALIADLDAVKAGNLALQAAFVRADEAALATMHDHRTPWKTAGRAGAERAALDKAITTERHAAWLGVLRPILTEGNAVVAVDALDAVGPGGLVEALRADGFAVTRAAP
jgi:uncharacterized protein YbaP (TraB family)